MNRFQIAAIAAVLGASAVVTSAVAAETTREQRMDQAMKNYEARNGKGSSSQRMAESKPDSGAGPMARAEESVKRGAKRTGAAIERGAKKTGNAIKRGATKTRDAIARTGERMGGSSTAPPNPNNPSVPGQ